MSLGRRAIIALLVLLAAGGLYVVWMSRHSFRRVPESLSVGMKGEALENPTLLLQKWIAAGGRPATRKGGELATQELPEGGALILLNLSQPISHAEVVALLAWVRRGGHLLTDGSAAPFNDERGLAVLHKDLGVTLKNIRTEGLGLLPETKETMIDTFHEGETPYRVRRSTRWRLMPDEPEAWSFRMGHGDLDVLLTREEGRGRITLTPDLSFLYYENLAEQDHADYLHRLLSLQPGRGPIVVWSLPVEASLFTWLWHLASAPILALILLLVAWVWKGWPRFGPVLPEPRARRRSLLEHLSASARLMWWSGARAHLVARSRASLEKRAQRLNPAYPSLDLYGRADWLAEATGGDAGTIAAALDDRPDLHPHRLAQDLLTLERLRQRLGSHVLHS